MPVVFISYSHSDKTTVNEIANQLSGYQFEVWQDHNMLHGGDSWPKRLGEAIRNSDAFILLWSKSASKSHYVELEWNTALALKKVIIPYFLDDTPLPATLASIQGVRRVEGIAKALSSPSPRENRNDQDRIIDELAKAEISEPKEVLKSVTKIITSRGLQVEGSIQNDGKIIINYHEDSNKKQLLQKFALWVTIVAGIVTVLSIAYEHLKKEQSSAEVPGVVSNENNGSLEGALAQQDTAQQQVELPPVLPGPKSKGFPLSIETTEGVDIYVLDKEGDSIINRGTGSFAKFDLPIGFYTICVENDSTIRTEIQEIRRGDNFANFIETEMVSKTISERKECLL